MHTCTFLNFVEELNIDLNHTHAEELSADDWTFIEAAYLFAHRAHHGVNRKGTNIPYITHPVESACITLEMTADPAVIAAALLHDVVEDTDYTIEDIDREFGPEIAALVASETQKDDPGAPREQSWKLRKQAFLNHLATLRPEAMIVALADKLSNTRAMKRDYEAIGDALWQRFNQKDPREHAWYHTEICRLTSPLSHTSSWKEYNAICHELFSQYIC